jgi:hypothetical protein
MTNSILDMLNIKMGMFDNSFFFQSTGEFCTQIKNVHQEIFLQESHDWRYDKMKALHIVG